MSRTGAVSDTVSRTLGQASATTRAVVELARSGVIRPMRPDRLAGMAAAALRATGSPSPPGSPRAPPAIPTGSPSSSTTAAPSPTPSATPAPIGSPQSWPPRDVEFVDALPRNVTGKVVHRELVRSDPEA